MEAGRDQAWRDAVHADAQRTYLLCTMQAEGFSYPAANPRCPASDQHRLTMHIKIHILLLF
jgi:hypothetical protein